MTCFNFSQLAEETKSARMIYRINDAAAAGLIELTGGHHDGRHGRNALAKKTLSRKILQISDYVILLFFNEDLSKAGEHWPVRQQLCIKNGS
jgi:hypothetical protein